VANWIKKHLGALFLLIEFVMHVYTFGYLVWERDALLVIFFTGFELLMFVYLWAERKGNHHERNLG